MLAAIANQRQFTNQPSGRSPGVKSNFAYLKD
jgi:hypothetical protein